MTTIVMVVHKVSAEPDRVDLGRFEDELVAMLHRYLAGPPDDRSEGRPGLDAP
ncbi:hypothetical protein [Streptomyces olivaceus]|uniref:hypothetical protein n=1 Tax=Streptomyces olivaceus TaxID=47716 RepID=UPI00365B9D69